MKAPAVAGAKSPPTMPLPQHWQSRNEGPGRRRGEVASGDSCPTTGCTRRDEGPGRRRGEAADPEANWRTDDYAAMKAPAVAGAKSHSSACPPFMKPWPQ